MITSLLIIVWFKPFFLLSFFFFSCPVKLPAKYSGSLLERQQMGNKFCLPVGSLPWLWMQQNCTRKGTSGNWWESKVWSREGNTEHWTCFSQLRKELCWSMSGMAAEQWFMDSTSFLPPCRKHRVSVYQPFSSSNTSYHHPCLSLMKLPSCSLNYIRALLG